MRIGLLGPVIVGDGTIRPETRDRIVLSALAIQPGEVVRADQLADAVWADDPPNSWHKNLQSCIVRLRKLLGADAIETSPDGYRLVLPADAIDVQQFQHFVSEGHWEQLRT